MTQLPATCTHDRGPGTTVCLRCQYEQRAAARARMQRGALLAFAGLATVAVLAAGAWALLQRARGPETPETPESAATPTSPPGPLSSGTPGAGAPPAPTVPGTVASAAAGSTPGAAPTPAVSAERPPVAPAIGEGRTELRSGVVAERSGDSVIVRFDDMMERTRRPLKFEQLLRATLPRLYGPSASTALAAWPQGSVARAGDLTSELPSRGLRIPLEGGWAMSIRPRTRPGSEGPLVVEYVARVTR